MALKTFSALAAVTLGVRFGSSPAVFSTRSSSSRVVVEHDRHNQRFTVAPGRGAGNGDRAELRYRFTGDGEVDLMSTYVPESLRNRGVAALLSQAALDFLVEENLKARVSCWYVKNYIEDHPLQLYKDRVIT